MTRTATGTGAFLTWAESGLQKTSLAYPLVRSLSPKKGECLKMRYGDNDVKKNIFYWTSQRKNDKFLVLLP